MPDASLPVFIERVRRDDPDRFFAALLAPAHLREDLLLVAAFDLEIAAAARRRTELAGPYPALIRLQWWRDLIEGRTADPLHEIAAPLRAALDAGRLTYADLLPMLDGREAEAEGVPDRAAWQDALLAGAGGASVAWARLLGIAEPGRLAAAGAARELWAMRPATAFLPADGDADPAATARRLAATAAGLALRRPQRAVLLPVRAARLRPRRSALAVQLSMLRLWAFGGEV